MISKAMLYSLHWIAKRLLNKTNQNFSNWVDTANFSNTVPFLSSLTFQEVCKSLLRLSLEIHLSVHRLAYISKKWHNACSSCLPKIAHSFGPTHEFITPENVQIVHAINLLLRHERSTKCRVCLICILSRDFARRKRFAAIFKPFLT